MLPRLSLLTGLLVLALSVGLHAQTAPDIPTDLQRTYGGYAKAMLSGEVEAAAEFYAEDAVVLVDSERVFRGRASILADFLRPYSKAPSHESKGSPGDIQVDRVVVGDGVVTLAGRYTDPGGTTGIYSNTWQRQADGRWKLAASVMTIESAE